VPHSGSQSSQPSIETIHRPENWRHPGRLQTGFHRTQDSDFGSVVESPARTPSIHSLTSSSVHSSLRSSNRSYDNGSANMRTTNDIFFNLQHLRPDAMPHIPDPIRRTESYYATRTQAIIDRGFYESPQRSLAGSDHPSHSSYLGGSDSVSGIGVFDRADPARMARGGVGHGYRGGYRADSANGSGHRASPLPGAPARPPRPNPANPPRVPQKNNGGATSYGFIGGAALAGASVVNGALSRGIEKQKLDFEKTKHGDYMGRYDQRYGDQKSSLEKAGLPLFMMGQTMSGNTGMMPKQSQHVGYSQQVAKIPGNAQSSQHTGEMAQNAMGWGNIL